MCDCVELTVKLKDVARTDYLALPIQSAYRLPNQEGTLWCRGEFPDYYVTNGVCTCGSVEVKPGGSARFVPLRFVNYFLSLFAVESVQLWWGDCGEDPSDRPRRRVTWSEFVDLNEGWRLDDRLVYEIYNDP